MVLHSRLFRKLDIGAGGVLLGFTGIPVRDGRPATSI
jgi:hypothetical protein